MVTEYNRLKERLDRTQEELRRLLTPQRGDLSDIKRICTFIRNEPLRHYDYKDVSIAVVIRLYSPWSLVAQRRVRRGVSSALAYSVRVSVTYLSKLVGDNRERYRLIPEYQDFIEEMSARVMECVKSREETQ